VRGPALSPPGSPPPTTAGHRPLDRAPTRFHDPDMKTAMGWMAGVMAFTLLAGGCATGKKEAPSTIAWSTAMDAALADAGKSGRPILLDFYTDW
jgi:hypothetical protein